MTPEDRELLLTLRQKQIELHEALARIDLQLGELEAREKPAVIPAALPPLPTPQLPPLPLHADIPPSLPPLPVTPPRVLPNLPPPPSPVVAPKPSLEFQFGKWLTAIGAVFGIVTLAFIFSLPPVHKFLGAAGLLGISGAISVGVYILGERLDRRGGALLFVGRTIMAMALAWLYLTAYTAYYYEPLQVIHSPIVAGMLLLLWSIYVLLLAERKKSQTLAVFAIFLAYVSSAINSIGVFTMVADLFLAATAVTFLVRNGWATLSYLSLIGTYLALLRRLVMDENGELVLDTSRTIHFWPYAIYLIDAWIIFTVAVIYTTAPAFRGGKRFAFLSLNNGALAGLLALTTSISGYDLGQVGWSLFWTGFVFLITSRCAGWAQIEADEVMAAYAAQGLALLTAGIMVIYTGITRGVLLMLETFFLGAAAAFSGDLILIVTTHVAAFFATLFLIWEIAVNAHHPWLFGVGGAAVLFINAWWSRANLRYSPRAKDTIVLSTSYYCALALGLIYTALAAQLSDAALPPALALAALGLTFSIYLVSLYELPPLAQIFLLGAQALVLFPAETGEPLPRSSTAVVAAVTVVALTWWARQRVTRSGGWVVLLKLVYALALVGLTYDAVRPHVNAQNWMVSAALLSVAFLAFGAFYRVWSIAFMGQLFLAVSCYHFFAPASVPDLSASWNLHHMPWTWFAAAVPIAVVFSTARATHAWLQVFPEILATRRTILRGLAYSYQLLALLMLARWIFAKVPGSDLLAVFLFLGTFLLTWNVHWPSAFGARCSFLLSALGLALYLYHFQDQAPGMATFLNGLAFLALLAQPALLKRRKEIVLVSVVESWGLVLLSVAMGWLFVSAWVVLRIHPSYLTMSWALYGLFLFALGLFVHEKRQRWCGLAVLLAAIVHVFTSDFWGFSNGYRVLTFIVLTLITLGLGFIYARFGERLKTWL